MIPPVAPSTKEQILLSLETDLKKILLANGFSVNIALVDRQREDWDQLTPDGNYVFPFVFVNDVRDDAEQQLLSNLYRRRLTVALVCGISVDPKTGHGTMGTLLNAFLSDVQKCITSNPYRILPNGTRTVYLTQPDSVTTDEGYLFPEAIAVALLHFTYFSTN